jgi:ABC-type lipoprotein export system ATPase subunit
MNTISLRNTLPVVFNDIKQPDSEVWLRDLNFEKGKYYLIEAASGKGKTSLCSYIYGYRKDYSGTILFDNRSISDLSKKDWTEIRRTSLSFVFQELRLFPELTAIENVRLKNNLTKHKTEAEIEHYFELTGIPDKINAKVGKMSFGQQQRVAVIRAICQPFDFILLDEPISHLDDKNGEIIAELVSKEAEKNNAGIIVTSIGKHINLPYFKDIRL